MTEPTRAPPQFTLRVMLAIMAAASVLFALIAALGPGGGLLFLLCAFVVLAANGIWTRRPRRALIGGVGAGLLLMGPWLFISVLVPALCWAALHGLAWTFCRASGVASAGARQATQIGPPDEEPSRMAGN